METALTSRILTSLSGRYAKALFEVAHKKRQREAVGLCLSTLKTMIQSSPVLKTTLSNPTISREERIGVLKDICVHMKAPDIFGSFLENLMKAGRIPYLAEIEKIYQSLIFEEKGEQLVEVISSYPLTSSQSSLLKEKLKKVFMRKLTLTFVNDSNVLGGIMVRVGSRVIDATLVTQLSQLAIKMKGSD